MQNRRALVALWIVCAGVIAWVWLRPLHGGPLPPPVTRPAHRPRLPPPTPGVAAPDDEPVADEPTAAPVRGGPPEQLDRHDLEDTLARARPKVLACQKLEQVTGFVTVKMVIAKTGNLQSVAVLPPLDKTRTADCVKHALRGLTFPRFRGTLIPTIEWTYPFLFKPELP